MITITLLGGPLDGKEYKVSWETWQVGRLHCVPPRELNFFKTDFEITDIVFKELIYLKQRFWQGWGCLTTDWDGIIKPKHAAEPEFKWCYLGNNWNNL